MSDDRVLSNIISEALLDTEFVMRLSQRYAIADDVLARLSSAGYQVIKAAETETEYGVMSPRVLDGTPGISAAAKPAHATHRREVGPWLPVEQEGPE